MEKIEVPAKLVAKTRATLRKLHEEKNNEDKSIKRIIAGANTYVLKKN